MSRLNLAVAAVVAAALPASAGAATISNRTSVPSNANIDLTDASNSTASTDNNGTQARYFNNTGNIRGVVQTFVWNSAAPLDGYGLLFDDSQSSFGDDQDYVLDVHLLEDDDVPNGPQPDAVVSLVGSETFTIEPSDVGPSSSTAKSLLYIDLTTNLLLVQGQSYAFHLRPDVDSSAPNANQRLSFANILAGNYNAGFGSQTGGIALTPGDEFGQPSGGLNGTDIAAFTTVVPEPTSAGVAMMGLLALVARRRR